MEHELNKIRLIVLIVFFTFHAEVNSIFGQDLSSGIDIENILDNELREYVERDTNNDRNSKHTVYTLYIYDFNKEKNRFYFTIGKIKNDYDFSNYQSLITHYTNFLTKNILIRIEDEEFISLVKYQKMDSSTKQKVKNDLFKTGIKGGYTYSVIYKFGSFENGKVNILYCEPFCRYPPKYKKLVW